MRAPSTSVGPPTLLLGLCLRLSRGVLPLVRRKPCRIDVDPVAQRLRAKQGVAVVEDHAQPPGYRHLKGPLDQALLGLDLLREEVEGPCGFWPSRIRVVESNLLLVQLQDIAPSTATDANLVTGSNVLC